MVCHDIRFLTSLVEMRRRDLAVKFIRCDGSYPCLIA